MQSITDVSIDGVGHLDDDRLLGMVRAGDIAAFDVLYRRHIDWARRAARWHLRSTHVADDVVSEAFMSTLRALQNGRGPHEGFRNYLGACIRNQCISHHRRPAFASVEWVDGSEYDRSVQPPPDAVVTASPIVAAFRTLNPRWQQALLLTAVYELDPDEAAARMGMCTNAMNALTYRAREALAMAYVEAHVDGAGPACAQVATKFARYVRGQACARDIEKVETHLAACMSCAEAVAELRDLNQTLRALPFVPACPPVIAVAVGLSWTGKMALIAGLVASASAVSHHPTAVDRPVPTRSPVSSVDRTSERERQSPSATTADDPAAGGRASPSGAARMDDVPPAAGIGAGAGEPSPTVAIDPAGTAGSPIGTPAGDGSSVPASAGTGGTGVTVTVPTTPPIGGGADAAVGGIVDLVTQLTGIDPNAPIVDGTVSLAPSGADASVGVDVAGIDAGVDAGVDLDEGTTVTVAVQVTVPNVLAPVVTVLPVVTVPVPPSLPTASLPPPSLVPLPTVPSLPPVTVVATLPPLGP